MNPIIKAIKNLNKNGNNWNKELSLKEQEQNALEREQLKMLGQINFNQYI